MKMLIPLDGSDFAESVLAPASKLWNASQAELHLLEVVNHSEAVSEAEQYLQGIAQDLPGFKIVQRVMVSDQPARAIIDYAWRNEIEMIALATHGRTGRARLMMGSVAGEILQAHVAPVFMVRPEGLIRAEAGAE